MDRGKLGMKRTVLVEGYGIPLGRVLTSAGDSVAAREDPDGVGPIVEPHLPSDDEGKVPRARTAEILADPAALKGFAEARESGQTGDIVYGVDAARALLAERGR